MERPKGTDVRTRRLHLLLGSLCGYMLALVATSLPANAQTTAPNEWTWMGGSSTVGSNGAQPGVYGTLGTAAAGNIPGSRWGASGWTDSSGNFWLFGGQGVDADGNWGYLNDLWEFNPSTSEWTWVGGSSTFSGVRNCYLGCGYAGVYSTLGTPAPGNIPGGRTVAANWIDRSGNFWLFGGDGYDSTGFEPNDLNDLWMYNPTTNEWTWMGGNSTFPLGGILGVYGTLGTPAAGNYPSGRCNASTATDSSGNFWLFGGLGWGLGVGSTIVADGWLNDIWEFNPSTNEWASMGGSGTLGQQGVYGTLGVPASGNVPPGREGAASWIDGNGNFWFFGGADTPYDYDNDLWEFAPSSMEWTWMGGSSTADLYCAPLVCSLLGQPLGQPGVYGELGTPSAGTVPGGRWLATGWTDSSGNLWLFGGQGFDANYYFGYLNDFWELNISTNPVQWTWMGGSSTLPASCAGQDVVEGDENLGLLTCGQPGEYGTMGTPYASNVPGGRNSASSWTDKSGDFWFFGGYGFDSSGNWGHLNDLWVFQSTVGALPAVMPAFSPVAGIYAAGQTVQISSATPNATIYYTTDGSTPTTNSIVYTGPITVSSTETIEAIATATDYANSALASAKFTIAPRVQTPTFSVPSGTYSTVQSVTISDAANDATIYYTTDGTTPTTTSQVYSGAITVSSTETVNAIATAAGYAASAVASAIYTIPSDFSVAVSPANFTVPAGGFGSTTVTVTSWGGFGSAVSFACSGLPSGASCSFSPATVTPPGTTSTTLTVSTSSTTASLHRTSRPLFSTTALAIAFCLFGWKKRRLQMLLLVAICAIGLSLLSGCGGGGSSGGPPPIQPVTSTVTITATSGSLTHATTFSLTVN